jgi:monoamine oxidase
MNRCDIVVVGAGAAGLAATRTLVDRGLSVVCLEARDRIGGRAWTDVASFGVPVDRGCAWLHSADINPWRRIAADLGFAVEERNPQWQSRVGRRRLGEGDEDRWDVAIEEGLDAIAAAGAAGRDVPASEVIDGSGPFAPLLRAVVTWVTGVEATEFSTLDYARYVDTGNDWPIVAGYGALVARYGAGLPVRLETPVTAIRWDGPGVAVDTSAGSLAASAAIVAVPPSVLAAGAMRFTPALPVAKEEAIEHIPLGVNDKVFLGVEGDPFGMPPDSHATAAADSGRTITFQFRPFGRGIVIGYVGGGLARELELAGAAAMTDFALAELVGMFGADARCAVRKTSCTGWLNDPWSRGAYSAARPGHAHRRADLAAPVADRLFFAGEACSIEACATCHGAYLSGVAAAEAAAKAVRGPSR